MTTRHRRQFGACAFTQDGRRYFAAFSNWNAVGYDRARKTEEAVRSLIRAVGPAAATMKLEFGRACGTQWFPE